MQTLEDETMPLAILARQRNLLNQDGYHIIYNIPDKGIDWLADLPNHLEELVTSTLIFRILPTGMPAFRYCMGPVGAAYYEIGIFDKSTANPYIGITIDYKRENRKLYDNLPKNNEFHWIEFKFNANHVFEGFYDSRLVGSTTNGQPYSKIKQFFTHTTTHNNAELFSLHLIAPKAHINRVLPNYAVPNTNLSQLFAGSVLRTYGSPTRPNEMMTIEFSERNAPGRSDSIRIDPKDINMIEIRILSNRVIVLTAKGTYTTETSNHGFQNATNVDYKGQFRVTRVHVETGISYRRNW